MLDPRLPGPPPRRALAFSLLLAGAVILRPALAGAHFVLESPASWSTQDFLGTPQKLPPCGSSGAEATGQVTALQAGQTITVTVNETVFHPGHYRIALAVHDRSELPPEPEVTPGSTPCGSVEIQNPPVFPVLADGVFAHTTAFSGPQSVQITLPEGVTCDHCTLQIIEFMGEHGLNNPGGCFYHHCADLSIQSVSVTGGSGGAGPAGGAGGSDQSGSGQSGTAGSGEAGQSGVPIDGGASNDSSGCSLPAAPSSGVGGLASLLALGAWLRRRRR